MQRFERSASGQGTGASRESVNGWSSGPPPNQAEVRMSLRGLGRAFRERRRAERARRAANLLRGLEADLFGHRMPSAAAVVAAAAWRRDPTDAWCQRCGGTLAACERSSTGCGECRGAAVDLDGVVRLGRYAPPLSQWVPAVKTRAWRDMGVLLGQELGGAVLEASAIGLIPPPDAVVPVPVHWLRRLTRGIDHTRVLAEEVARACGAPVVAALRVRLAPRQTGGRRRDRVSRAERFAPTRAASRLRGASVLLVDDVRTSGATSAALATILRAAGARRVSLATCAVTDRPRRASLLVRGRRDG